MNNSVSIDMSEINTLEPFFKDQEKLIKTVATNSIVKGAYGVKRQLASATPSKLKKFNATLAVKKQKPKGGIVSVLVGYFGRKVAYVNRRGKNWDAYLLLLWKNYGTLAKRSKSHVFRFGRRPESKTWKGGIEPVGFYDLVASTAIGQAYETIDNATEEELMKQLKKYGFK